MAILVSTSSGNFTSSGTWSVVDATSAQTAAAGSSNLTTTQQGLPAVVTGAITVSAICARFASITASPTGTLTVQIFNSTDSTVTASVTVNVSDLPSCAANPGNGCGWFCFKFASPVTLAAGKAYTMRMATSSAGQIVAFYTTGSAINWLRLFVTTSNAAPGASDTIVIGGQYTSAGVNSSITVTMDDTSGTVYGNTFISAKGTMTFGTSASTNYRYCVSLAILIAVGGSLIVGTQASPIPASSTATLEFAANIGIYLEGTFSAYGDISKATGVKLAADVAVGATSSTITNASSGWKSGDKIMIASTATTYSQYEVRTLNADASGTTITHDAYVNAHGGNSTTLVQADISNLTRNIKIFGTVAASPGWLWFRGYDPTLSLYGVEVYNFGNTNAGSNAGLLVSPTTAGTLDIRYSSFYNLTPIATAYGYYGATPASRTTIKYCAFHSFSFSHLNLAGSYATTPEVSYCTFSGNNTSNLSVNISDYRLSFNNNVITSNTHIGLVYSPTIATGSTAPPGNLDNLNIYSHSSGGVGFKPTNNEKTISLTMSNWRIWRTANFGIYIASMFSPDIASYFKWVGLYMFGNSNMHMTPGNFTANVIFDSCYFWSGTGVATNFVFKCSNTYTGVNSIRFVSSTFGKDYLGNTSALTVFPTDQYHRHNVISFYNCTFPATEVNQSQGRGGIIDGPIGPVSLKHNGVTGSHKAWGGCFIVATDTTIFRTSSPSQRITPGNATNKSNTQLVRVPLKSGNSCTVSVAVRKSVVGDGTAYNGNQPRLMYRQNHLAGNNTETVGATASGSAGSWEILSYTTPSVAANCVAEFYVDCDGTTGWVNVDDWNSTSNDSKQAEFWGTFSPYYEPDTRSSETMSAFLV